MPTLHSPRTPADARSRWPRLVRAGLATAVLFLLQACGPGLGGTGTGQVYGPADFGAQPTSACQSLLADILRCSDGSASQPGAGPQDFAGLDAAQGVRLQLDPSRAWLHAPCAGLQFEGDWGLRPAGEQAYYGGVVLPGRSESEPAWLQVLPVDADDAGQEPLLTITLWAPNGPLLFGPVIVQRVPAGQVSPPASCP
jgi:hypothetical protein